MLAAGESAGLVPMVRVGTCEANPILRVLDSGAYGVMAAHVRTKDDAQALVSASRYPPVGIRGVNSSTRATGFGRDNFLEHVQQSNEEVLTIALVEDQSGVEAIEEIVEVDGLDVVLPGPGDLSASMGLLGQLQHPKVQESVARVAKAVHARPGLVLGCFVTDPSQICRCEELDARFVVFGQDSRHLFNAYQGALASMREQWGS
jgi:4-hydroxy-2-oxoheptanedioate aldolase